MKVLLPITVYILASLAVQIAALCFLLNVPILPAIAVVVGAWMVTAGAGGIYVWYAVIAFAVRNQKKSRERTREIIRDAIRGSAPTGGTVQ